MECLANDAHYYVRFVWGWFRNYIDNIDRNLETPFCWCVLIIERRDSSSKTMGQQIKRAGASMNDTIQSNLLPASPRKRREDALNAGVSWNHHGIDVFQKSIVVIVAVR
jgi:hypothetical protein